MQITNDGRQAGRADEHGFGRSFAAFTVASFAMACALTGCGGSSSSDPEPHSTISGRVFAGKVSGASISVYDASEARVAGPVTTDANGNFTVSIKDSKLGGVLSFRASGGVFTDEATGDATTSGALSAYAAPSTLAEGVTVAVDPASTILEVMISGGMSKPEAEAAFLAAFGYTPDGSILPAGAPGDGITQDQLLAGFHAGVFSRMALDSGLTPAQQFDLIAALGADLSDGALDGKNGATLIDFSSVDASNRFERASAAWVDDPNNLTGLAADAIGTLPFSKVATTATYKVTYMPGMMAAAQGRTQFKIKVEEYDGGAPVTGLSGAGQLKLTPMMHMADMAHSSPSDSAITDNGDGTYTCVVYYLMSSSMGGMSMGFWDMKVTIGPGAGESVWFYPNVGMAMGTSTVRATLKGQADMVGSMSGSSKRTYYLFRDSLTGTDGNHSFRVFVAAGESMMSFPGLHEGLVLHNHMGAEWTASDVDVEASTNGTDWVTGAMDGESHYLFTGLTGLSGGVQGTIYLRLTVNGERKTTDGSADAGANGYASFTVTP